MTERTEVALAVRQNKLIRRQSYVTANYISGFSVSEADTLIVVKNTKQKTGKQLQCPR